MIRLAFSTVACPNWTLEHAVNTAAELGFVGLELRSFGQGGTEFACDPALTSAAKVRRMFIEAGIEPAMIASGVRFDAPVFPPVLCHVLPSSEASIREGRHMVQVASDVGAPFLRVFAFDIHGREGRRNAIRRITERLFKVCDYARGRDVMILIENGGAFPKAEDLVEIMNKVPSPLLGACYDALTAVEAKEDPAAGCAMLGSRLRALRLRDSRDGAPCRLGKGILPGREVLKALRASDEEWGTDPWLTYSWDRAWISELSPAEEVLPAAYAQMSDWAGGFTPRHRFAPLQSAAPAMML